MITDKMTNSMDALTRPEVAGWSGPDGHTLLFYEVDFRDGGSSRLRVRSPEGVEYRVEDARLEIVEPERIVFTGTLGVVGEPFSGSAETATFRRTEGSEQR